MNTRLDSRRWVGVALLVALLALFTVANVHAQDPMPAEPVLTDQPSVAAAAETCPLDAGDPDPLLGPQFSSADCARPASARIHSIELTGDAAWFRVSAGDKTEIHVYLRTDTGLKRIPYSTEPYEAYLLEVAQETMAWERFVSSAPQAAATPHFVSLYPSHDDYMWYLAVTEGRAIDSEP